MPSFHSLQIIHPVSGAYNAPTVSLNRSGAWVGH